VLYLRVPARLGRAETEGELVIKKRPPISKIDRKQMFWALSMGSRGGLMIAGPVMAGLLGGWWLDGRFGTLPWITLALTVVGAILGPLMAYKWVMGAVRKRVDTSADAEQEGESH